MPKVSLFTSGASDAYGLDFPYRAGDQRLCVAGCK